MRLPIWVSLASLCGLAACHNPMEEPAEAPKGPYVPSIRASDLESVAIHPEPEPAPILPAPENEAPITGAPVDTFYPLYQGQGCPFAQLTTATGRAYVSYRTFNEHGDDTHVHVDTMMNDGANARALPAAGLPIEGSTLADSFLHFGGQYPNAYWVEETRSKGVVQMGSTLVVKSGQAAAHSLVDLESTPMARFDRGGRRPDGRWWFTFRDRAPKMRHPQAPMKDWTEYLSLTLATGELEPLDPRIDVGRDWPITSKNGVLYTFSVLGSSSESTEGNNRIKNVLLTYLPEQGEPVRESVPVKWEGYRPEFNAAANVIYLRAASGWLVLDHGKLVAIKPDPAIKNASEIQKVRAALTWQNRPSHEADLQRAKSQKESEFYTTTVSGDVLFVVPSRGGYLRLSPDGNATVHATPAPVRMLFEEAQTKYLIGTDSTLYVSPAGSDKWAATQLKGNVRQVASANGITYVSVQDEGRESRAQIYANHAPAVLARCAP